ncbi:MAG: hypothetical protein LBB83_07160 [Treponema sp.]|nr:hypothetical protein [Treponema sp.]
MRRLTFDPRRPPRFIGHSWQHSSVDVFEGGKRKHHFHDGTYLRDGTAMHDGMVLLPLPI